MMNTSQDLKFCAIQCLRARHDAQAAVVAQACLTEAGFDWDAFLAYIRRERISPLIHHAFGNFATGSLGSLPPAADERIRKDYLNSIWTNSLRLEDLRQILASLDAAGIPVTLLKGAALICSLYEKMGLRPMTDIDLLVPPEHFERVGEVLVSCGYAPLNSYVLFAFGQKEVSYRKPGRLESAIDLHCELWGAPHQLTPEQSAWFWQNRTRVVYEGQEVWIFNPTAQFLHLCAHLWLGHSDEGDNLLRMFDIDQLIRRHAGDIDWAVLLTVAQAFDLLLPLQKTLPELVGLWQSPVPEDICTKLAQLVPTRRERRKFGRHWRENENILNAFLHHTMSYPDWHNRLRSARQIVFPPWQYIVERYHVRSPLLVPYFYAHRLVSRAIQQVGRIFSLFPWDKVPGNNEKR